MKNVTLSLSEKYLALHKEIENLKALHESELSVPFATFRKEMITLKEAQLAHLQEELIIEGLWF